MITVIFAAHFYNCNEMIAHENHDEYKRDNLTKCKSIKTHTQQPDIK